MTTIEIYRSFLEDCTREELIEMLMIYRKQEIKIQKEIQNMIKKVVSES